MRTWFTILILGFSLISTADVLPENERSKKKLVSRMYQATEAGLEICPSGNLGEFRVVLNEFESAYSELDELLKSSRYRGFAVSNFADEIKRIKN